jgi:high-affinity nickel-transport protein
MQKGERPLGIGFFFSQGHSTIVLLLAIGIAIAAVAVKDSCRGCATWAA